MLASSGCGGGKSDPGVMNPVTPQRRRDRGDGDKFRPDRCEDHANLRSVRGRTSPAIPRFLRFTQGPRKIMSRAVNSDPAIKGSRAGHLSRPIGRRRKRLFSIRRPQRPGRDQAARGLW
jgi:hypothetical protein